MCLLVSPSGGSAKELDKSFYIIFYFNIISPDTFLSNIPKSQLLPFLNASYGRLNPTQSSHVKLGISVECHISNWVCLGTPHLAFYVHSLQDIKSKKGCPDNDIKH